MINVQIILTWMGLTRLERSEPFFNQTIFTNKSIRYFSMPPTVIPKAQSMPLHFDTDPSCRCASPYAGPEISRFTTLELSALANCILEYDAAQRNGRIQKFIRDNRYAAASPQLAEKIKVMLHDLEEYLAVRRAQMEKDGAWAGIHVVLGYESFSFPFLPLYRFAKISKRCHPDSMLLHRQEHVHHG